MTVVAELTDLYREQHGEFSNASADDPIWLKELRDQAMARFVELGFPGKRNEEWRFTNLAPLTKVAFERTSESPEPNVHDILPDQWQHALVFVNGRFSSSLSKTSGLPDGVVVRDLASTIGQGADAIEATLGKVASYDEHSFVALNTGFIREGAFISIPRGKVVEKPIHLAFISASPGKATIAHPRILVQAGSNSQATIVEHYVNAGSNDDVYFNNVVSEVVLDENAHIDHYKVQDESIAAFHIASMQVNQARSSNFRSHYVSFGGRLVRNEARVYLGDEGCEATLNGLYLAGGTQHVDSQTVIDHAKPHCNSHEIYKGILGDKAEGVFNGKIFVREDAQKTDAKQTNKALLLSEDATINTKPQLEIFADDVKCTHGATVGQLDKDSLFYLRSRGIPYEEARGLLIYAFANDVLDRIRVDSLRERLEHMLQTRRFQAG